MINTTVTVEKIGEDMGVKLTFNDLGFILSFCGDGIELSTEGGTQLMYVLPSAFSGVE